MSSTIHEAAGEIMGTIPVIMQSIACEFRRGDDPVALPHFRVMMRLSLGPATLSDLAGQRGVTLPTMSSTMNTLVGRGWVERRPHAEDRRKTVLSLTPEGRGELKRMAADAEALVSEMLSAMDDEDRDALVRGLSALRRSYARAHPTVTSEWADGGADA